jgi:hypothetical protein
MPIKWDMDKRTYVPVGQRLHWSKILTQAQQDLIKLVLTSPDKSCKPETYETFRQLLDKLIYSEGWVRPYVEDKQLKFYSLVKITDRQEKPAYNIVRSIMAEKAKEDDVFVSDDR